MEEYCNLNSLEIVGIYVANDNPSNRKLPFFALKIGERLASKNPNSFISLVSCPFHESTKLTNWNSFHFFSGLLFSQLFLDWWSKAFTTNCSTPSKYNIPFLVEVFEQRMNQNKKKNFQFFTHNSKEWKENATEAIFKDGETLTKSQRAIIDNKYYQIFDFENHLDDASNDWTNEKLIYWINNQLTSKTGTFILKSPKWTFFFKRQ